MLVAYYVPEPLSDIAQERLLAASAVMVSELAQIELFSALALRQRLGHLSLSDAQRVVTLFAGHLAQGLYISLRLSSAVYQQAQMYIRRFDLTLKAPDALHLATAAFAQAPPSYRRSTIGAQCGASRHPLRVALTITLQGLLRMGGQEASLGHQWPHPLSVFFTSWSREGAAHRAAAARRRGVCILG